MSEAMLAKIRDAVQKDWDERITKIGGKLDSITVRSDKIAGFTALVSTIIQSPAGGALGVEHFGPFEGCRLQPVLLDAFARRLRERCRA